MLADLAGLGRPWQAAKTLALYWMRVDWVIPQVTQVVQNLLCIKVQDCFFSNVASPVAITSIDFATAPGAV